jgi:C-terminal peptidase prc
MTYPNTIVLLLFLSILLAACGAVNQEAVAFDSATQTLATEIAEPIVSEEAHATATQPWPTPWPTPDAPLTEEERSYLIDQVWFVIRDRYIDAELNGLDWGLEWSYWQPRALDAPDDAAFYQEIKWMVARLNDQHTTFMDPHEAYDHFAYTRNQGSYGGFGFYTMLKDEGEGALVLQVYEETPAAKAGIQACDTLLELDGQPYQYDTGDPGTTATLTINRPDEGTFELTLTREEVTQVLDVPAELLPNRTKRIGYVRLDSLWVEDIPDQLRQRLVELEADAPLEGLIIDLRPNPGGWRVVLQSILSIFVEGELGKFSGRLLREPLIVPSNDDTPPTHPNLPLSILTGPKTESYAEILAATLQAEGRALLIGEQTTGNVESIYPYQMAFSAYIWIAEQGFELNDGQELLGIGVTPDIIDHTDWTQYPCGRDPQIKLAAEALEKGD